MLLLSTQEHMTCRRKKNLFSNLCWYTEISTGHTMIIVLVMNLKQKYEPCSNNQANYGDISK